MYSNAFDHNKHPWPAKLRKFFGSYFYSLVHHSALQYRIISGRTANSEKEEATFNSLKTFTNVTSNDHSNQVVTNALIRTQAKEQLQHLKVALKKKISKTYISR